MNRKELLFSAAVGATAAVLACAGGEWALASTRGPVNPSPLAAPASAVPASFADIVQRVAPAVVSIDIVGKTGKNDVAFGDSPFGGDEDGPPGLPPGLQQFFRQMPQQRAQPLHASGSGFFISGDGYIVTNNHVVDGADKITVRTTDERSLPAHVVGRDPETDLAVIKVDGHNFPFVSFEDRAKPRVGDWVVAVGNPFNLGGTATAGIVSAMARPRVSGSGYVDYMQIDAPINRGNSGGPTFDLYGRVVGVNSAIFTPSGGSVGIGFDIPADVAASVSKQLISNGKVVRGYIGATIQDMTPDIAESLGLPPHQSALIADVTPDGPGAKAGLQSGDLVMSVDGHPVTSASDLTRQVALARAGDDIRLGIRRDGRARQVNVRSGIRPADINLAMNDAGGSGPVDAGGLGMLVAPTPGGGVRVERVLPGSKAGQRGVQPGDVIDRIGSHAINSAADISQAIAEAHGGHRQEILMRLLRHGQHRFLPVEVPAASG
ncbi:trypsin-like peptidase domain-containing protein [Phenylobacterium sp.]|jgi:serine protease Do|uniref:trypsin-like peptidase domain-containing protein n=1 Tax=Phenylobacterium sp. TaxID=1871053 RepID=UPI002E31AA04|nr:trypsin-like peptidase domain-containing protein [Phenylobacterium sp.]HEX4712972.1 trypsin-like peptidase domain-containing protein [Phenylobacterium sp.]